ncbi:hypothetical protein AAE02nite_28340 [Adhaeribacter aerolatus]|uniref:Uncharacterized protein n=1 Tax=Adhaeribacter aerolatus TaxID=670289 RepID=A0A512AZP1_9BACT|nr:hypothetical protein [Adhaeribacter aerolatus]GEO05170.1 hypothetical protein AAE02nite_28340 [Adhaeribacter aerolatus]
MTIKELKEYKARLYNSLSRDLAEFEKNFLFISTGTLAFSITFIKDIVKIETAIYLQLLFTSWGFITLATGIMMFTFIRSAYASDKLWFAVDTFQIQQNKFNDADTITQAEATTIKSQTNTILKSSKVILRRLRYLAIACFILGLIFFGYFTGVNIYQENQKSPNKKKNGLIINFNSKTKQFNINDIKFTIKDSSIIIQ